MQHKRSPIIVIITLLLVVIVFFVSGKLDAPEAEVTNQYEPGQLVSLKGQLVCLPHRDQSGPQTMECAYGFRDESGTYYALQDTSSDYSLLMGVPMSEDVEIEGIYRLSESDKYQQNGTIELRSINR